jgi:hypothetical protein
MSKGECEALMHEAIIFHIQSLIEGGRAVRPPNSTQRPSG